MEQWIEVATKNGVAVLVLLAAGVFFYKKVWPLIEKRDADADLHQKENLRRWEDQGKLFTESLRLQGERYERRFDAQGKIFMEAFRQQGVFAAETHKESMRAQGEITKELRALNNGNLAIKDDGAI